MFRAIRAAARIGKSTFRKNGARSFSNMRTAENTAGQFSARLAGLGAATGLACYMFANQSNVASSESSAAVDSKVKVIQSINTDGQYIRRKFKYVIIGAGTSAYAALRQIKANDPHAKVLIIAMADSLRQGKDGSNLGNKLNATYSEWRRHMSAVLPDAYTGIDSVEDMDINVLMGTQEMHLDPKSREILFQDGGVVMYDKCLIATTGTPRDFYMCKLIPGDEKKGKESIRDRINYLRNIEDFEALKAMRDQNEVSEYIENIVVVGGGFLGTEVALSLSKSKSYQVNQILAESGVLKRYMPSYLTDHMTKLCEEAGVIVKPNLLATKVEPERHKSYDDGTHLMNRARVHTVGEHEKDILADYLVLASTHVDPSLNFTTNSQLEVDPVNGGIVVNNQLESMDGLYVCGHDASYFDPVLGRRRVQRYDHALMSGEIAGHNMSSEKNETYDYQPSFYSNLGTIGYELEGIGQVDSNLTTVGVFMNSLNNPFRKGVVYYLDNSKVVGILLVNSSDHDSKAREILKENTIVGQLIDLKQKISLGPEEWTNVFMQSAEAPVTKVESSSI